MSIDSFVTIGSGELRLPQGLVSAWCSPRRLALVVANDRSLYLRPVGLADRLKCGVKRAIRRADPTIWFEMRGSSFQADRPIPEGAYRVVNYDETVQLLPADETADSDSRGRAWASYSRYHEHLPIPEQDPRTNRISRWLAQEILSFEPRHALELGCGAGRNLYWLEKAQPGIGLRGIEINPHAAALAREWGDVNEASIYELGHIPPKSIDVVFTSGVLMHVPSDRVESVIRSAHRIARKAVIHFELHGPSYSFDYHRYPRDYGHLYQRVSLGTRVSYKVFPRWDFRSRTTQSFRHALLVSRR